MTFDYETLQSDDDDDGNDVSDGDDDDDDCATEWFGFGDADLCQVLV